MSVDAQLLEILVCPNDRGEIDYFESDQVIVCRTCGYRYPVRDDIPVMLIDEAEKPPSGSQRGGGEAQKGSSRKGSQKATPRGNPEGKRKK